ncbi:probable phosphatase phospho2 isoform X2 [Coccinella septempunctata]|uniref:probable phosphatase phospho2 isoform X2 n=1 Tax=Coccinella septempunctata TaxID=41139 RepID=UPI001D06491F|nr:probable phosphatase phospho2 isoform X2 [Coccinella septempunctata]
MKNLAVFDFDHTIIELNSDVVIASMIPGGVPESVKKLHCNNGWIAYMQGVFDTLHIRGYNQDFINNIIMKLDPVVGMLDLIKELVVSFNYDVIIISDSNSHFIDTWLTYNNLKKHILEVFSNPAVFEGDLLKIKPYHLQDYCNLSSKNLCKGQILQDFITQQKKDGNIYNRILYAGDGANDLCPILRLKNCDHAFVRSRYKLEELIEKVNNGEIKDKSVFQM